MKKAFVGVWPKMEREVNLPKGPVNETGKCSDLCHRRIPDCHVDDKLEKQS